MGENGQAENQPDGCAGLGITRLEIGRKQALRQILSLPYQMLFGERDVCWLWPFDRDEGDYGVIWEGKFAFAVHRLSFQHYKGEIPEGQVVMHSCDRPPCFNPLHLFAGTQQENIADMVAKGRHWRQK